MFFELTPDSLHPRFLPRPPLLHRPLPPWRVSSGHLASASPVSRLVMVVFLTILGLNHCLLGDHCWRV
jgi:hypothetical protein